MTESDEQGDGKPHGNEGGHPRAHMYHHPNGQVYMRGRGKPSYTFTILFFAMVIAAIVLRVASS